MTALPFALLPHGILSSLSAVMAPYILPFLSAAMAPYIPPSLSAAMALYIPLSLSATMVPCIPHSPSAAMTQCIPASPSAVYHLLEGTFQQPPYNPFGPLLFHVLCSRHTRYLYPPQSLSHRRVSSLFHNLLPWHIQSLFYCFLPLYSPSSLHSVRFPHSPLRFHKVPPPHIVYHLCIVLRYDSCALPHFSLFPSALSHLQHWGNVWSPGAHIRTPAESLFARTAASACFQFWEFHPCCPCLC